MNLFIKKCPPDVHANDMTAFSIPSSLESHDDSKKNDYISLLTANNLLEGSIKYTCLEDVILAYKHHYQNCYSADPVKV